VAYLANTRDLKSFGDILDNPILEGVVFVSLIRDMTIFIHNNPIGVFEMKKVGCG
jgi:hypothetical protein